MTKRRIVLIVSGLLMFLVGIALMRLSMFSRDEPVPYKEQLQTFMGSELTDVAILFTLPGRCGVNINGSFHGSETEPVFRVRDFEGDLVYVSPNFPPPSNSMEFDIESAGLYSIEFNVTLDSNSQVEVYQYRYTIEKVYPYEQWYYPGIGIGIIGLVLVAAIVLRPSKK